MTSKKIASSLTPKQTSSLDDVKIIGPRTLSPFAGPKRSLSTGYDKQVFKQAASYDTACPKRASSLGSALESTKPTLPNDIQGFKKQVAPYGSAGPNRASSFGSALESTKPTLPNDIQGFKKQVAPYGSAGPKKASSLSSALESTEPTSPNEGHFQKRVCSVGNDVGQINTAGPDQRIKKAKVPKTVDSKTVRPHVKKSQAQPQNECHMKQPGSRQVSYSKEAEEKFDAVLAGDFTDIPPLPRSTVRIFLSSTFSDMRAERNALAKEAYPILRDFCTNLGLSFQVVDLRWGVTAEAINNHLTTKICLLELENCQNVSLGPNCIALISNRYGFCPLPHEIPVEEFDILISEASELGLVGVTALNTWYKKDFNAIPLAYYLQPITSQLPYFLDSPPGQESKKQADSLSWTQIEEEMLATIHIAAVSAYEKNRISHRRKHFYLMSVTEHEARNGIIEAQDPNIHGLLFIRDLEGLDLSAYDDANAEKYKDLVKGNNQLEADTSLEALLNSFKRDLAMSLEPANVYHYTVDWQDGRIQPDKNQHHHKYISEFCSDFVNSVKELINMDRDSKESPIRQREYYSYYSEILHHAHFCQLKCATFCGQEETLNKIKYYILDCNNRKPFVLYAQSGTGKTSVLAMAMMSLSIWIQEDHVGIIRFIGTSPLSTDIYNVLFSVCGQLADIAETVMEPQCYRTMRALAMYISRFFRTVASALKRPVVIFLDSLDQLEDCYDAYTLWWLPTNLPANFKVIVSTLPQEHGILDSLHLIIDQRRNIWEIPLLPDTTSKQIVNKYLTNKGRKVTNEQLQFILNTFRKSPNPLYLKLLMDQAVHWNSYTAVSKLTLPNSVRAAISHLFDKLEVKYGARVVEGALGLITVGLNGLSEIELEDALSCINEVMIEVYKYHDPPVSGMVRIPPVLWARIRFDIQEYLVERHSQGVITLYWYHRLFIEVASERYTQGSRGQYLHYTLFELFAAEKGVKKDITLLERQNLCIPSANRNTTPQPMVWTNVRKLECLSYHLKYSMEIHDSCFVKRATYCNMHFLKAKILATGVEKLIYEMEECLQLVRDSEIEAVLNFVITCKTFLREPLICAFSVVAYISTSPLLLNLEYLKTMAQDYLLQLPKTLLIPTFACLASRTGEPEKVHNGLSHVLGYKNEVVLFGSKWDLFTEMMEPAVNHSITLSWLDMTNPVLIKHICNQVSTEPYITADGKDLLYLTTTDATLVRVHIETGQMAKMSLSNVFAQSALQFNKLPLNNCLISGSTNSKHLVIAVENTITLCEYPELNYLCSVQEPSQVRITNLHCCSGPLVTIIVTSLCTGQETSSILSIFTFWNATTQDIIRRKNTNYKIHSGASSVTSRDEYHVCFGSAQDKNTIQVTQIKSAEAYQPVVLQQEIKSMKVSQFNQEAFFHIGDSGIHVLNVETQKFIKCLEHGAEIVAFDVAWDEDRLIVADVNNRLTLYNKNFEKQMSRSGHFGSVSFVAIYQDHMLLHTGEGKVKIWIQKEFFSAGSARRRMTMTRDVGKALDRQEDITCFVMSDDSKELITMGRNQVCRVWSLGDDILLREFTIGVSPTKLLMGAEGKVIAFDSLSKQVIIFKAVDGKICCNNIPENVICLTLTRDRERLVLLTKISKPVIQVYDLKLSSCSNTITIQMSFKCMNAEIYLTATERYAALMYEVTPEDYKTIAALRNKGAKFPEQKHPYRFTAVDLTQDTGTPYHVYFHLSKVPQLGLTMEPYKGNTMMVSSWRWIMFWDIPTGNCGQSICKFTRKAKMYRPDWLGQDCVGSNNIITMSLNKQYVAVGSEDGYVFVYEGKTGMPVGMKSPSTSHPSPVNNLCFNHATTLLASTCAGGYMKLWQPGTGNCVFSVCVGTEIKLMGFSPDGSKFVAVTAAEKSHVLIFQLELLRTASEQATASGAPMEELLTAYGVTIGSYFAYYSVVFL